MEVNHEEGPGWDGGELSGGPEQTDDGRSPWHKWEYRAKRMEVLCSRKEDMGIVRYVEGSRRDMVEWVVRVEKVLE